MIPGSVPEREGLHPEIGPEAWVPPRSLYIHVPVCASKCAYCDFYSVPPSAAAPNSEGPLVEGILARAEALCDRFGAESFDTVYVGGGTPTFLSPPAFDRLLAGVGSLAGVGRAGAPGEWTVEANPDSLDGAHLDAMASRGVSRISIGVQSLDSEELKLLGRRHGPHEALRKVGEAASRGFSVSADLMACLPRRRGSSASKKAGPSLAEEAVALIDAGALHLSVYDLTLEEGTPLAAAAPGLEFPGEDEAADERQEMEAAISARGFRRYEVSNYAPPGLESRHNLTYWKMGSYLGAGPGAVSTIALRGGRSLRIEEAKSLDPYLGRGAPAVEEFVELRDAAFETIMMAFRTRFGLDLGAFKRRFGLDAGDLVGRTLELWKERIAPGDPWPLSPGELGGASTAASAGPALDGEGLDLLNRFLGDCLDELDRSLPRHCGIIPS